MNKSGHSVVNLLTGPWNFPWKNFPGRKFFWKIFFYDQNFFRKNYFGPKNSGQFFFRVKKISGLKNFKLKNFTVIKFQNQKFRPESSSGNDYPHLGFQWNPWKPERRCVLHDCLWTVFSDGGNLKGRSVSLDRTRITCLNRWKTCLIRMFFANLPT